MTLSVLKEKITEILGEAVDSVLFDQNELTLEIKNSHWFNAALILRDHPDLSFNQCIDVAGVDYLTYGLSEWETFTATENGFERGVERQINEQQKEVSWNKPRFAVAYHFLSLIHNHRLRVRVFPEPENLTVESITPIWPAANWFEREAFDLFGINFKNHPDLRRILTDYGFVGHPFRKDFPLIGNVEVRYDATLERVIYVPVSIKSRTLVPKVIREREKQ